MSFGPHLLLALLEGAVTACVLAVTALGLSLVFGVMRIVIGMSDGVISMFFSPTLAKILATLPVALVLVVRPGGLFGERG